MQVDSFLLGFARDEALRASDPQLSEKSRAFHLKSCIKVLDGLIGDLHPSLKVDRALDDVHPSDS